MEVVLKGKPEEIAALVVALQERQEAEDGAVEPDRTTGYPKLQRIPADSELGKKIRACLDDAD